MAEIYRSDIVRVDLDHALLRKHVGAILVTGDKLGNRFGAEIFRDGNPVDVTGCGVTAYFMRPGEDAIVLNGTASGSVAYVDLAQACYSKASSFTLTIKLSYGGSTTALRVIDGYILLTQTDDLVDPGEVVPTLDDIFAQIAAMETATERAHAATAEAIAAKDNANGAAVNAVNIATEKGDQAIQLAQEEADKQNEKIAALTEDIARNTAPAIIPTATVSIVTITDGAARPAVELISHIEPLQRWNSAKVQRTGKNILPGGGDEQTGSFLLYPTDKAFEGLEGQQINVSFDLYSPDGSAVSVYAYQQSGLSISTGYDFMPGAGVYARYSFSTTVFRYGQTINPGNIIFYSPSGAAIKVKNVQVEFGTTATAYEPYEGKTISATLPETVYGGTLDWTTGVLTSALDAEGNELDEPKVFQLTPQQLDMLKGANNVWSDCGDTTLSYVADTKSYIDQRIAALLNV